ncbi:MAG: hypothetical protein EOP21_11685 [Hyphomicrobiales bacterium]|nr:MAG: hypothetical protein EOP21_11685 [Hyphomicrobiales bacterium]
MGENCVDSHNSVMPYVDDITEPLIVTLTQTGGLPARQLAGHAANLEFWVGEVKHAIDVIDGYGERFKKLIDGERIAAERIGPLFHPFRTQRPVRPGIGDHELKELRRRLTDSAHHVLGRCYREGFVSETEIKEYGERLDLDTRELKRKKGS